MTQALSGVRFLAAYSPPAEAGQILGILAWCASACGVGGLIIVGMQMALQLRRGDPGEGGEHFRGVFFVGLACLVATTAGPVVAALGELQLLGP
ncbi:hypothetical protein [Streptomyces sp. NBC_00878]|uniref:hypothetical protein n=1 Tax=Streptomyces sp. NBC_00878 TaxID=2975854 RepID=UPI0022599A80|nr:hypothetical protein [Streptomyces sp. NBC_00878]MCX4904456.1 hypothetical protein [Streptomyces sp. NBC_00878]